MESFEVIASMVLGVVLRLGIPIVITVFAVWLLRKLDITWRKEAEAEGLIKVTAKNPGCWDFHNCPEEKREECKAYQNPDQPCWHVYRDSGGNLKEQCLSCEVFIHAPVPILS